MIIFAGQAPRSPRNLLYPTLIARCMRAKLFFDQPTVTVEDFPSWWGSKQQYFLTVLSGMSNS